MNTVLIPPDSSNHALAVQLENSGAGVLTWPGLEIGAPLDDSQLGEAIANLFGYDWLILKNDRAADYFMRSFLKEHSRDELDDLRVLAIGSEASDKASESHIHIDIALERFAPDKVYQEIKSYVGEVELARLNVLIPGAGVTRELFEEQLEAGGSRVDSLTAYRTCTNTDQLAKLRALLAGGGIDCIAFTRASAINEFACLFDTDDLPRLLTGVTVLWSDPSTARAAKEFGLAQSLTPSEPPLDRLSDWVKNLGK